MDVIAEDLLGAVNVQLNTHAKEIALLNRRIEVLTMQVSGDDSPLYLYMKTNDQRNSGFAASIQSITDQLLQQNSTIRQRLDSLATRLRNELTDRLQIIDVRLDEIQHVADNSKCAGEILELKVAEIRASASQLDFPPAAELCLPKEAKPPKLKKSLTRPESTQSKQRIKLPGGRHQLSPIGDEVPPSPDVHFEQLQAEVQHLKDIVSRTQSIDEPKMARINQRLDECAKKSDVHEMIQCFMNTGANGASQSASPKRSHCCDRPRLAIPNEFNSVLRCPSVHVQLINGETLHRPATHQAIRPRS